MELTPTPKKSRNSRIFKNPTPVGRDSSGIALFMVLAAVSLLAILVSEFTYIAQISQMIAFGGLDQAKAHYLAKSGLKISLLRLKAYKQVRRLQTSIPGVPKSLVEKIWSFPFMFPLPTAIPGLSPSDRELIEKFQKQSGFEGSYSAVIESESSKYNLNLLLENFAPPVPTASPSMPPAGGGGPPPDSPQNIPTPQPSFNSDKAQESLYTFLNTIFTQKMESDPDFATLYRDFRLDELVDNIRAWSDRTYERRTSNSRDRVPLKRAPFYSVSELHMVQNMDDDLYQLFAPSLTASTTVGININTMKAPTLRAIVPQLTLPEVEEFFKFRDSMVTDNHFNGSDDFFKYLQENVSSFKGSSDALTQLKKNLQDRRISLITIENQFKITVRAQVNSAVKTIEAWVTLDDKPETPPKPGQSNPTTNPTAPVPDSGLKITYMRIL